MRRLIQLSSFLEGGVERLFLGYERNQTEKKQLLQLLRLHSCHRFSYSFSFCFSFFEQSAE